MKQSKSALGPDQEASRRITDPRATSPQASWERVGPTPPDLPGSMPDLTASALGRLMARIEGGTAAPGDVAHMPPGVLGYLAAVAALCDAGVLA